MKQPVLFQRVESAVILLASLYFYVHLGFNLIWFIVFLLAVDIFMVGYATKNRRVGALVYNTGHSYVLPPIILIAGTVFDIRLLVAGSLIWFPHIGMDRMLGYGLKSDKGFKDTHLGKIGKK